MMSYLDCCLLVSLPPLVYLTMKKKAVPRYSFCYPLKTTKIFVLGPVHRVDCIAESERERQGVIDNPDCAERAA